MKKTALATTLTALYMFTAQAATPFSYTPKANNTLGLYLGGQIWQSEANVFFGELNTLSNFNLKKEQQINYFVAVEHPYYLFPNVRIANTTLDTTGKKLLTQALSFGDESFAIGDNVNARFNVSYVDYTLYYELFDSSNISFDLGLTVRDFNGAVTINGSKITEDTQPNRDGWHESCYDENGELKGDCSPNSTSNSVTLTGNIKTDDIVPMLYVATNISLPLTGLNVFVQGDYSIKDEYAHYDYQVGFSYNLVRNSRGNFGLTLGYKVVEMQLEDVNNLSTDLEFKGAFIGAIAHF